MTMPLPKCVGCGQEIQHDWPRTGTLEQPVCMGCESIEIEVFKVSLPGGGDYCVERDISGIKDMLENMDEGSGYLIEKTEMPLLQFIALPEFQGF